MKGERLMGVEVSGISTIEGFKSDIEDFISDIEDFISNVKGFMSNNAGRGDFCSFLVEILQKKIFLFHETGNWTHFRSVLGYVTDRFLDTLPIGFGYVTDRFRIRYRSVSDTLPIGFGYVTDRFLDTLPIGFGYLADRFRIRYRSV